MIKIIFGGIIVIIRGVRKAIKKVTNHIAFKNTTYDEALDIANDKLMKDIHKTHSAHAKKNEKIISQQAKQRHKTLRKVDKLGRK